MKNAFGRWRRLRYGWLNSGLVLAGLFLLVGWPSTWALVTFKGNQVRNSAASDVASWTAIFEHDTARTIGELDRAIIYLRENYDRLGDNADWPSIVGEKMSLIGNLVQIAVTDRDGMMITSSAMLHPTTAVDLSDREHFRVHINELQDELFISKPVMGRASRRLSIQLTRRYNRRDGSFGGVIIVSLSPDEVVRPYIEVKSLANAAFVLIGNDDVVRAGGGLASGMISHAYREGQNRTPLVSRSQDMSLWTETTEGVPRLVGTKRVGNFPLSVVVSADDPLVSEAWRREVSLAYLFALAFASLVVFTALASARRDRRHVRRITDMALTDTLTGLGNRHAFHDKLGAIYEQAWAPKHAALHLIDLDRFKAVNDTFGHGVGDKLLASVAGQISASIRVGDQAFRLGGDEFAIVQENCRSQEEAAVVAQRIVQMVAQRYIVDGHHVEIGVSVGTALCQVHSNNTAGILQAADLALYLSKSEGRGTFRIFNAELGERLQRRRQIEAGLTQAIEKREFVLFYQPTVDASGVVGYEALVRWNHPVHGLLPPAEFISVAEDTGQIVAMGQWILREACSTLAAHVDAGYVSVNVSPIQFLRGNVVDQVRNALSASGLPAKRLVIEITETSLMRRDIPIIEQLEELRRMGVSIALDDFGTGYSSLSYLHTYPIDSVKIDRSFVARLGRERSAAPIIRAIVTMATDLQMRTVAEGVETSEQVDALLELGCKVFQGYYFGSPRAADELWPDANSVDHSLRSVA